MPKMFAPNIDEYSVGPPRLVPGTYEFEVTGTEEISSQRTGRAGLKLDMVILSGPADSAGGSVEGREFTHRLWMYEAGDKKTTQDALGSRLREALEAFGVAWDEEGFEAADFIGMRSVAKVVTQKDDDEYVEIKRFIN